MPSSGAGGYPIARWRYELLLTDITLAGGNETDLRHLLDQVCPSGWIVGPPWHRFTYVNPPEPKLPDTLRAAIDEAMSTS